MKIWSATCFDDCVLYRILSGGPARSETWPPKKITL